MMRFSPAIKTERSLLAFWKLVLSFRKTEWDLRDYPVFLAIRRAEFEGVEKSISLELNVYRAEVVNWIGLAATGNTKRTALRRLAELFYSLRMSRASMPRPGMRIPLEFCTRERVEANAVLAGEFIRTILGLNWAWISDESSLWDFTSDRYLDTYFAKICEIYGVDASGIANGNLADILETIARSRIGSGSMTDRTAQSQD
jgi:hypothetical protein